MGDDVLALVEQMESLCKRIRAALQPELLKVEKVPAAEAHAQAIQLEWDACCDEAKRWGFPWRRTLLPQRRSLLYGMMKRYRGRSLVTAVRGFFALSEDWSTAIRENCANPEYVFRRAKVELHFEAGERTSVAKKLPPVTPPDVTALAGDAKKLREAGAFGVIG